MGIIGEVCFAVRENSSTPFPIPNGLCEIILLFWDYAIIAESHTVGDYLEGFRT